ncbi:MAG: hypothetical protein RL095_46 [Verrucomicrobiota bacterium]
MLILSAILLIAAVATLFMRRSRGRVLMSGLLLAASAALVVRGLVDQPRDLLTEQLMEAEQRGFLRNLEPNMKADMPLIFVGQGCDQDLVDRICALLARPADRITSLKAVLESSSRPSRALVICLDGIPASLQDPLKQLPSTWLLVVFKGPVRNAQAVFAYPGFLGVQTRQNWRQLTTELDAEGVLPGDWGAISQKYFCFWRPYQYEEFLKSHRVPPSNIETEEEQP